MSTPRTKKIQNHQECIECRSVCLAATASASNKKIAARLQHCIQIALVQFTLKLELLAPIRLVFLITSASHFTVRSAPKFSIAVTKHKVPAPSHFPLRIKKTWLRPVPVSQTWSIVYCDMTVLRDVDTIVLPILRLFYRFNGVQSRQHFVPQSIEERSVLVATQHGLLATYLKYNKH
jgi:hypothetical protein